MKMRAAFLIVCTLLAFEAAGWEYHRSADQMGRGEMKLASVFSRNQIVFSFPYGKPQRGELTLRVHPRYGSNVILDIERGQFLCRLGGCSVVVRFDDGTPERFAASQPADHSSDTLFIRDYSRFLERVRRAKLIRIEAQFFQEGIRILEFDVSGLDTEFLGARKQKPGSRKNDG